MTAVDLTTLDGRIDAVRALAREAARARTLLEKVCQAVFDVGDNATVAAVWQVLREDQ